MRSLKGGLRFLAVRREQPITIILSASTELEHQENVFSTICAY